MNKKEKKLLVKHLKQHLKKCGAKDLNEQLKMYLTMYPLDGKRGLRRMIAQFDLEYFGRAYFPEMFESKSPKFHEELNNIFYENVTKYGDKKKNKSTGKKIIRAAPRGHAKSTNLTFKCGMHSIAYNYKKCILIISDSSSLAKEFLESYRDHIESNEEFIKDFGDLVGKKWTDSEIKTANNCRVVALGSGMAVRGKKNGSYRPDLIIFDDVENDKNINTPVQRQKLRDWFDKAVLPCGDKYSDFVYIGTILHLDSLLKYVSKKPDFNYKLYKAVISFSERVDLWNEWKELLINLDDEDRLETALNFFKKNEVEMLKGTEVLWNEKRSYYDLMLIKVSDGERAFFSEQQNNPVNPDDCLFEEGILRYIDLNKYKEIRNAVRKNRSRFLIVGAVDPSLGKNDKSDYSSIAVILFDKYRGQKFVIRCSVKRRKPSKIITDTLAMHQQLKEEFGTGFNFLGVETIQFQAFFKDELQKECTKQRECIDLREIYSTGNKRLRIESLEPLIRNGYIKFFDSRDLRELISQLVNFGAHPHDDAPDSLQMASELIDEYMGKEYINKQIKLKR